MTSAMSSSVLTIVQEATRMQEVTDSILNGMKTQIRNLEIQNSDLNQRMIALEMAIKKMPDMGTTNRLMERILALETTVAKELATAKALREVEAMAQMALNQLDALAKPAPVVESLDVVTALIQIEDYLMSQLEKDGQMMSSVIAMRKAAKEIQEVVKMVQVMQAS